MGVGVRFCQKAHQDPEAVLVRGIDRAAICREEIFGVFSQLKGVILFGKRPQRVVCTRRPPSITTFIERRAPLHCKHTSLAVLPSATNPTRALHQVHRNSFRDRLRMLALFRVHPAMARSSRAVSRLKLFKDHLEPPSLFELNTPFSTERSSPLFHDTVRNLPAARPYSTKPSFTQEKEKPARMSTQEAHPALLIPGPIEFDDAVLQSMSHFR
jgi:hypothetical protein